MRIDDIIAAAAAAAAQAIGADPEKGTQPQQMSRFMDAIVGAEDITPIQRDVLCAGYMAGLIHALAIVSETGDPGDIVGELMAKEAQWDAQGWI